jgi:predicted dehydrogenase
MSSQHEAAVTSSAGKTRFGVIGTGLWGSFHCKTLTAVTAAAVLAVCDSKAARRTEMQTPFAI